MSVPGMLYFFYGLAFFALGLAMALEASRTPLLPETRTLWPLAAFGLSHGLHEWLYIFQYFEPFWTTDTAQWLRVGLLVFSFLSLIAYGVQVWRPPKGIVYLDGVVASGMLLIWAGIVLLAMRSYFDVGERIALADALARYLLAVPGGLLAALVLRRHAHTAASEGLSALARALHFAWPVLILYAGSQIFVPPVRFGVADRFNSDWFQAVTGMPVQGFRTILGFWFTFFILRSIQAADAGRQRAYEQAQAARLRALEARDALQRQMLRRVVLAQEAERARISRELHDELAQNLTAASLTLGAMRQRLKGRDDLHPLLDELQGLLRGLSQDVRRLVHDLRPAQLDDLGLQQALRWLADRARRQYHLNVVLEMPVTLPRLPALVETILFRITQEALTNAARHGEAQQVVVLLQVVDEQVHLHVVDDGHGFDLASARSAEGVGLVGIAERVESVNGRWALHSRPGKGTRLAVWIDLNLVEAEKND